MGELTELQAYDAMGRFLHAYWERTGKPAEIGSLLGDVSRDIWADGTPGDPASWPDWQNAVDQVLRD